MRRDVMEVFLLYHHHLLCLMYHCVLCKLIELVLAVDVLLLLLLVLLFEARMYLSVVLLKPCQAMDG